jgi:hypothetical protein
MYELRLMPILQQPLCSVWWQFHRRIRHTFKYDRFHVELLQTSFLVPAYVFRTGIQKQSAFASLFPTQPNTPSKQLSANAKEMVPAVAPQFRPVSRRGKQQLDKQCADRWSQQRRYWLGGNHHCALHGPVTRKNRRLHRVQESSIVFDFHLIPVPITVDRCRVEFFQKTFIQPPRTMNSRFRHFRRQSHDLRFHVLIRRCEIKRGDFWNHVGEIVKGTSRIVQLISAGHRSLAYRDPLCTNRVVAFALLGAQLGCLANSILIAYSITTN